jgi:nucleotide-binding universal stress UspA family protein
MSTVTPERPAGHRILVALDASPRSLAALATASALAAELDAELAGLFVEDVNLQRLLALPFTRELCLLSGELRPFSRAEIERTWRRDAQALQRRLAEAADPLQVRWSFRVVRGRMEAELSLQAQEVDLVVLGRQPGGGFMTAVQATARARHADPVLVLIDDVARAGSSLDLGARLARRNGAELVLLIHAADEADYRAACAAVLATLKNRGDAARCVWLSGLEGAQLVRAVRREKAGCLVLADRERFLQQGGLDDIACPIVLSR